MSKVFVLDSKRQPMNPIHPGYARRLLAQQQAAVFRRFPFTIIMKCLVSQEQSKPLRIKIDPGSATTGLALVDDASGEVVWAAELTHHGRQIKAKLDKRRSARRSRRQRKTRYRESRFANRRRQDGWLAPSLESRIANILTWVARLRRWCSLEALSMELVRFDTQLMQNAEIRGIEYQQGALAGHEVREYLLEKWNRRCGYCQKTGIPLEVEHIVPKARGGSNRVSNLTIACESCNRAKGAKTAEEFGHPEVQAQAKQPLKDAAVMNTTRWALYKRLQAIGLSVEVGTGARTKWNRTQRNLPKTHWLDAACVGASTPEKLHIQGIRPLLISATGWQCRQMCRMDKYGFPRTSTKQHSRVQGFHTGDTVRAMVRMGKNQGTHVGRVAVRATGSFNVTIDGRTVQGIAARWCSLLHRQDGYSYAKGEGNVSP